jgi:hypothetical protein
VTAVTAAAGLAVAGCAPLKMGAAATVGSNAISVATLTNDTGTLQSAAKSYGSAYTLTSQQATQATLTWLIRFKINDQLASNAGLTITQSDVTGALTDIGAEAEQDNVKLDEFLVTNGVAPSLIPEVGRWEAINLAFLKQANGGSLPTSATSPAETKLTSATCEAAKSLNIAVNPQFGRMSYTQYTVVNTPDSVSRASGTKQTASIAGQYPAC